MTTQELIAKVLELDAKAKSDSTDAREDFADKIKRVQFIQEAAPILARMLQEAILQRDAWATMIEEHKPYLEINNAKLDRIAKGEE